MEKAKEGSLKRVVLRYCAEHKTLHTHRVVGVPWDTRADRALRMSTQVRDAVHHPTFYVWIVTAISVEKEN